MVLGYVKRMSVTNIEIKRGEDKEVMRVNVLWRRRVQTLKFCGVKAGGSGHTSDPQNAVKGSKPSPSTHNTIGFKMICSLVLMTYSFGKSAVFYHWMDWYLDWTQLCRWSLWRVLHLIDIRGCALSQLSIERIPEIIESINLQASGYWITRIGNIISFIDLLHLSPAEASRAVRKKLKHGNAHQQYRALVVKSASSNHISGRNISIYPLGRY